MAKKQHGTLPFKAHPERMPNYNPAKFLHSKIAKLRCS